MPAETDLEALQILRIERVAPAPDGRRYVRFADIPEPFRAEFRAWLYLANCPVIDGEDFHGCAWSHDFDGYRSERLHGQFNKWRGVPPWLLKHYEQPL